MKNKVVKKKNNIVIYTILMFFLFILVANFIWGGLSNFIIIGIFNFPYGEDVVVEAVLAILILILMLAFKNSYVFNQKREPVKTGLFYGLYCLIFVGISCFLFQSVFFENIHSAFNLFLHCILIGIAEEFLCRGWLLNEFLERFGNSKKRIWYCIIISSLLFGLIHLVNLKVSDLGTTLNQVVGATAFGVVMGVIYYKTKNIWSVVLLHALWDFAAFLPSLLPVTQISETFTNVGMLLFVLGLLTAFVELVNIVPYINDIDAKPQKKTVVALGIFTVVAYIIINIAMSIFVIKVGDTYKYDEIELTEYSITRDNYSKYYIKNNDFKFELAPHDNNLVFKNLITEESMEIKCSNLIDYTVAEFDDYYILSYIDFENNENNYIYYVFIDKIDIGNSLDIVKTKMLKYLLPDMMNFMVIKDGESDNKYLAVNSSNIGTYLLIKEDTFARLK